MKHEAFMLGTSKGKHTNKGFDLFITTAPIPDLNEKLIVFGQVVRGEDVVQVTEFALFCVKIRLPFATHFILIVFNMITNCVNQ